jgi:hypothetical protein
MSEKAPGIQALMNSLSVKMSGSPLTPGKCASCAGEAIHFRDELSVKENRISFLCQDCQDSVFGMNV